MDQMLVLTALGVAVLLGFLLYPAAMFHLFGAILRGLFSLLVDGVALLFAWI